MLDYTLDGVPVARISTDVILSCLENGFEITDTHGDSRPIPVLEAAVKQRLELELLIRREGLR